LAKKRFPQARPFLAFGIVVLVWAIVPFAVKALARVSFYEFQAPAHLAASYARDLQDYWSMRVSSKNELIEAGKELAQINARYELTIRENEELRTTIARLEAFNGLPIHEGYRNEIARVVRRDFSGWWQQLVIRKGRADDIQVGDPVVFVGGVVGRVREVDLYTSVVDLVSSQNIRLAAKFEGDNRPVAYRGGPNPGFANARGRVEFVPQDITATPGRPATLVTSGHGGVFPPGLPIGKVALLERGPDGQFKVGEVILDERLSALAEVAVLVRAPTPAGQEGR
jgi:rod shape-determining protein MreC